MTKLVDSSVLDAALNVLKTTAVREVLCSSAPANFAAVAGVMLATRTISSASFTGPAAGDVSGRKITINSSTGNTVTNTGTGTHVALTDGAAILLYLTTCPSVNVDSAGTVDMGSWKVEIAAPT